MADWIAIASGKGGVGKTTVAVNLATALALEKKEVLLLDANMHAPSVGLHLGSTEIPKSIHHVLRGEALITDAIYAHPSGLQVMPGDINYNLAKNATYADLDVALSDLNNKTETIIIDTPEGIGKETQETLRLASGVVAVTTPDLPSVIGTLKLIRLAQEMGKEVHGVIVNKWRGDSFDLPRENISSLLEQPILAMIPFHNSTRHAIRTGHPVVYAYPNSPSATAFQALARHLVSEPDPIEKMKGWVNRNV